MSSMIYSKYPVSQSTPFSGQYGGVANSAPVIPEEWQFWNKLSIHFGTASTQLADPGNTNYHCRVMRESVVSSDTKFWIRNDGQGGKLISFNELNTGDIDGKELSYVPDDGCGCGHGEITSSVDFYTGTDQQFINAQVYPHKSTVGGRLGDDAERKFWHQCCQEVSGSFDFSELNDFEHFARIRNYTNWTDISRSSMNWVNGIATQVQYYNEYLGLGNFSNGFFNRWNSNDNISTNYLLNIPRNSSATQQNIGQLDSFIYYLTGSLGAAFGSSTLLDSVRNGTIAYFMTSSSHSFPGVSYKGVWMPTGSFTKQQAFAMAMNHYSNNWLSESIDFTLPVPNPSGITSPTNYVSRSRYFNEKVEGGRPFYFSASGNTIYYESNRLCLGRRIHNQRRGVFWYQTSSLTATASIINQTKSWQSVEGYSGYTNQYPYNHHNDSGVHTFLYTMSYHNNKDGWSLGNYYNYNARYSTAQNYLWAFNDAVADYHFPSGSIVNPSIQRGGYFSWKAWKKLFDTGVSASHGTKQFPGKTNYYWNDSSRVRAFIEPSNSISPLTGIQNLFGMNSRCCNAYSAQLHRDDPIRWSERNESEGLGVGLDKTALTQGWHSYYRLKSQDSQTIQVKRPTCTCTALQAWTNLPLNGYYVLTFSDGYKFTAGGHLKLFMYDPTSTSSGSYSGIPSSQNWPHDLTAITPNELYNSGGYLTGSVDFNGDARVFYTSSYENNTNFGFIKCTDINPGTTKTAGFCYLTKIEKYDNLVHGPHQYKTSYNEGNNDFQYRIPFSTSGCDDLDPNLGIQGDILGNVTQSEYYTADNELNSGILSDISQSNAYRRDLIQSWPHFSKPITTFPRDRAAYDNTGLSDGEKYNVMNSTPYDAVIMLENGLYVGFIGPGCFNGTEAPDNALNDSSIFHRTVSGFIFDDENFYQNTSSFSASNPYNSVI